MKYHRHLAIESLSILQSIFEADRYADKAIEAAFKAHPKWGARDRHFVAETVYEGVRWWRKVWSGLGKEIPSNQGSTTELDYWNFLAGLFVLLGRELPYWEEFRNFRPTEFQARLTKLKAGGAQFHSYPDWMFDLVAAELREDATAVLSALNEPAEVVLRANRLKGGAQARQKLLHLLADEGIEAQPISDLQDGLKLSQRGNVFRTKAFKEGWFEVQDASSQRVAELLQPCPGERIVDACAGAGGKTLHMAGLMGNKGKIVALDVHQWKLDELKQRARRAGADIIETRQIESSKVIKRLEGAADAVLLDVPCSGLGVLRRNPDTKWKLTEARLRELQALQREILQSYSRMVKAGGRMVYSTCSILPSENQLQVNAFLADHPEWQLVKEVTLLPHRDGYDGFFMALMKKA